MKSKFLIPIISLFAAALLFGTTYSAWVFDGNATANNTAQVNVPSWSFERDSDFAKIEGVSNCAYLEPSKETTIVNASNEAVRLTNTAGTQTKDHSFVLATDRVYTVDEIKVLKVEFDYYHAKKREQVGKGFPKVELTFNGAKKGNTQGGGETCTAKSPFIATNIDSDWWHLEYFITALCPTSDITAYSDSPISKSQKINGIRIIDSAIYNFDSTTAYIVVDNVSFSSEPCSRLGLFNRGASFKLSEGHYWMKICWAGELQSCVITSSDPAVMQQDSAHPFYILASSTGSATMTATLTMTSGQVLTISNTITVTAG